MGQGLRRYLLEPSLRGLNIDDPAVLDVHRRVIKEKVLLQSAYGEFYSVAESEFSQVQYLTGSFIELGSGVGFIKETLPFVRTSDFRSDPNPDFVLDATSMNLADSSVAGFFAINVFHHLPYPRRFFSELSRTLVEGGVCILIEPHRGALSKFVHSRVHQDEFFDLDQRDWDQPAAKGALSHANQAMSDIIFGRDIGVFEKEFGKSLAVNHGGYVPNHLRFLASGGLNYRPVLPSWTLESLCALEKSFAGLHKHSTLHQVWILKKRS